MKKLIVAIIFVLTLLAGVITVNARDITVVVEGKKVFPNAPVLVMNDRTMLPLRDISNALGYKVLWNDENKSVIITDKEEGSLRVIFQIGVNGLGRQFRANNPHEQINFEIDIAPVIVEGRTYVPVRAVSEALFCDVKWDNATSTVTINKKYKEIGAISAGKWSKLMAIDKAGNVCLLDMRGNVIIPLGPEPKAEDLLKKTSSMEIIKTLEYTKLSAARSTGWARWEYRAIIYDANGRPIFITDYALDGTVHYVEYRKITDKGIETYVLYDDYNPNDNNVKDNLYLRKFEDNTGKVTDYGAKKKGN